MPARQGRGSSREPLLKNRLVLPRDPALEAHDPLLPHGLLLGAPPLCAPAENVNIKTLGLFALVMFPYTWKFLWAPFFDSVSPVKGMGRRRGWLLVTQTALFLLITIMGLIDPKSVMSLAGLQVSGVTLAAAMCFLVHRA